MVLFRCLTTGVQSSTPQGGFPVNNRESAGGCLRAGAYSAASVQRKQKPGPPGPPGRCFRIAFGVYRRGVTCARIIVNAGRRPFDQRRRPQYGPAASRIGA